MWGPRAARAACLLLVAASLCLLAWRFARLDLAGFINDEPRFLEGATEQLRTGRWLSASPFPGTQGVRYGPAVFWFYAAVASVWNDHPRTAIVAMCAVVSLAHLALAAALARAFGGGLGLFATLLAFLASSPYQFFWSRLAWDQTVDWTSAAVVAVLAVCTRPSWPAGLAVGALIGFALSSHLMVLPFAAAVVLALAWEAWTSEDRRGLATFAASAAAATLLVTLPYLCFLATSPRGPMQPVALDLRTLAAYALEPARVASVWGIEYFFDDDWGDFQGFLGGRAALWQGGLATALLIAAAALLGIVVALRSPDARARRLGRLALLTWLLAPFVLATRTLARHPHYQFGTWWLVPLGLAAALAWLNTRHPVGGRLGALAVWLLAAWQAGFVGAWLGYVDDRVGTRGIHYGTPVGHQEAVMRAFCGHAEPSLVLSNETALFRRPLLYWTRVLPECRDKQIVVCGAGARAGFLACPTPASDGRLVHLVYARDRGGALRLVP